MKVRMIFAAAVDGEDLPAESTPDLSTKTALALVGEGRAEPCDPADKAYQAWLKKQPVDEPSGDPSGDPSGSKA